MGNKWKLPFRKDEGRKRKIAKLLALDFDTILKSTNIDITNEKDKFQFEEDTRYSRKEYENVKDTKKSYLKAIHVWGLPGMENNAPSAEGDISISLKENLVIVTGETGSGKSLVFCEAVKLISGGKAKSSLLGVDCNKEARVDAVIEFHHPYSDITHRRLEKYKIPIRGDIIHFSRRLYRSKMRLQSTCFINDIPVSLSLLRDILSPLLVVVDASLASRFLSLPSNCLNVLDAAVEENVKEKVRKMSALYKTAFEEREKLEAQFNHRILPH